MLRLVSRPSLPDRVGARHRGAVPVVAFSGLAEIRVDGPACLDPPLVQFIEVGTMGITEKYPNDNGLTDALQAVPSATCPRNRPP